MTAPIFADVEAIYFDLDDTLCGYWDAARAGLLATFAAEAGDLGTPEVLLRHWATEFRAYCPTLKQTGWYEEYLKFGEPSRTELMRLLLLRLGVDDLGRARTMGDRYALERNAALSLFHDAEEVLNLLHPHYPMGLITNGPADVQRSEVEVLNLGRYMTHVFIEGEMGRGKPHAAVFHAAASAVGLPPSKLLFVGNSYAHDIAPAINAGWYTAWVRRTSDVPPSTGDDNPEPETLPVGAREPHLTISNLSELLPALGR